MSARFVKNAAPVAFCDATPKEEKVVEGVVGPQGPQGPKGDPGPAKTLETQEVVGTTVNEPSAKDGKVTATAVCPTGTKVVGGGFVHGVRADTSKVPDFWFWESRADLAANSWKVSYQQNTATAATFPITPYASCASLA